MNKNAAAKTKAEQRQFFRKLRRELPNSKQCTAAHNLWNKIKSIPDFRHSRKIALYFACDGEISPHVIARFCNQQNRQTFYPVITGKTMIFRRHRGGQKLQRNRFGIPEPQPCRAVSSPKDLDLVILPLVSFDRFGGRLGMGGGFYDRTFAFRNKRPAIKPLLIGVAHSVQQSDKLILDHWDIPLDMIVTDRDIFQCNQRNGRSHW